jgi:hypothetical protein
MPCLACGRIVKRIKDRCLCSIDAFRATQGFSSNIKLRSLNGNSTGASVFSIQSKGIILADTIIGELYGIFRSMPAEYVSMSDQICQFAVDFPIYSSGLISRLESMLGSMHQRSAACCTSQATPVSRIQRRSSPAWVIRVASL